jgi:hypothetical protein
VHHGRSRRTSALGFAPVLALLGGLAAASGLNTRPSAVLIVWG